MKIMIPSNFTDIWTRVEVLLGLKLNGRLDTSTEASNLIEKIYKKVKYKTNNNVVMLLIKLY